MNPEYDRMLASIDETVDAAVERARKIFENTGVDDPVARFEALATAMWLKLRINPTEVVAFAAWSLYRMVQDKEFAEALGEESN